MSALVRVSRGAIEAVRRLDTKVSRYREPDTRDILLDARTSMEYAMMAPVHEARRRRCPSCSCQEALTREGARSVLNRTAAARVATRIPSTK